MTAISGQLKGVKNCRGGKAMNIEKLDGFFSPLIAGPEIVLPSEYMPEVFGGETPESHGFSTHAEVNEILALLMRHWNPIDPDYQFELRRRNLRMCAVACVYARVKAMKTLWRPLPNG
jgi:uncharacterized protein